MDFEVTYEAGDVSDKTLFARSNLWLLKSLCSHMALDFDSRLSNRLRLLTSCLTDVKFDIMTLTNARTLSRSNPIHKRSLGSLIYWLIDFLDSRPVLMTENSSFLNDLNAKIISQIKIFPTVFGAIYYKTSTSITYFAQIRLSQFDSGRLEHLLDFNNIVDNYNNSSGKHIYLFSYFHKHLLQEMKRVFEFELFY